MQKAIATRSGEENTVDMTVQETQEFETAREAIEDKRAAVHYKNMRAMHYPAIGDQLDALLKIFLQLREEGNDLPSELNSIISDWMAVKEQFPKPNNGNGGQGNGP